MAETTVKINIDKFLSPDYLNIVDEAVNYIIESDDQVNARDLIAVFTGALNQVDVRSRLNPNDLAFYNDVIVKLQFIALPLLDNKQVINLLATNFVKQFPIADYKLLDKFNYKLLNIILVPERNNFKQDLLRAILTDQEIIVANGPIRKINDWLKNYVSAVGLDTSDKLDRAQYLMSLRNNKAITAEEYEHLSGLFRFYDELNIPADSPQGWIEESPVSADGKLYIFRKGMMEPISANKDLGRAIAAINYNNENNGSTSESNKSVDVLADSQIISSSDTPSPAPDSLAELEASLPKYSESSLEYKAIKQEINRLKVGEFKQAQQSAGEQKTPLAQKSASKSASQLQTNVKK